MGRPWVVAFIVTLGAAGCDDGFTPFTPTDRDLIVYGYLDASADTQWIRVAPVRTTLATTTDPAGITVTLEHQGTGRVIALRDSLFNYRLNPELGTEFTYLHNFWTTERIAPGSSYRLSIRHNGAVRSEIVLDVPAPYEIEVWLADNGWGPDILRLSPLRHVGYVTVTTYFYDTCGSGSERRHMPVSSLDSDVQTIALSTAFTRRGDCGRAVVERRELWIAGSGTDRPTNLETPSTIPHATGFVIGVLTKTAPYEPCYFEGFQRTFCRIRYDAAAATVSGRVRDPECPGDAIQRANVQLLELEPEVAALPQIRSVLSDRSGRFQIAGLVPGKRYALSARPATPEEIPGWTAAQFQQQRTDTLVFSPGQHATRDIPVTRITPCGSPQ